METKHTPIWKPEFWKTIQNDSAPGGKVDAYLVVDDDTGEGIITIAVPHGDKQTPERVCIAVNNVDALEAALKECESFISLLNARQELGMYWRDGRDICERTHAVLAAISKEREP